MSALADNSGQEPLGTMLVRRGLISDDQLQAALAEQKASGQPLGAIVVARGFAPAATIAQALATQHGGLLKTEYGFATGFGNGLGALNVGEPPVSPVRLGRGGAPAPAASPPVALTVAPPAKPEPPKAEP